MAKDKIIFDLQVGGLEDIQSANDELLALEKTAQDLKAQLSEMDEGSDSFKKLNKDLGDTTKSINVLKDATGKLDLDAKFDDIYQSGAPLSSRLGELEDRMYELALAGQQGSEGFKQLQTEAVNIRQTIIRVDESIDDLAANKGLSTFGDQLSGIGSSLASLDFTRAAAQAQGLANNAKNIDFKTATASLKNLGSTFVNLGKALLANPLFLIAAVIVGIVLVVKELMDAIGLTKVIMNALGKVFEFLMIPINALINGLKALTDWFGWTSNAAEEESEKKAAALEDAAKRGVAATNSLVQSLDHEIRMMELSGKSAEDLKNKKLKALSEQSLIEQKAAKSRYEQAVQSGELDREEIIALKDKAVQAKLAYQATLNEIEYFNAESKKKREDNIAKEKEDTQKANDDLRAQRQQATAQRLADEQAYNDQRLTTKRLIEDLDAEAIVDATDRELEQNRLKYERLIEDTLSSETLLAEEKDRIKKQYEDAQVAKDAEIKAAKKEEDDAKEAEDLEKEGQRLDDREAFLKAKKDEYALLDAEERGATAEIKKMEEEARKAEELLALEEARANELISLEEFEALKAEAIERSAKNITAIEKAEEEARLAEKEKIEKLKKQAVFDGLTTAANLLTLFGDKNKKAAKAAFRINQGMQIAQTAMDTFKSATGAFSSLASIPIVGPALGAAAAAAAVTAGLLNIKKIASTKFDEGGGGGAPSAPAKPQMPSVSSGGSAESSAPTPPSINLFGEAAGGSEGEGNQSAGARQRPTEIRAVVVESDITSTQNRIATYQERSEIG